MARLREQPAQFEDLMRVVLSRTRIEKWIDEPFFEDTLRGVFVKVGTNRKYDIAEVKDIKDDDAMMYKLTNGKKTGKYLQLMTSDESPDKMKWFKINRISNQPITRKEFEKFKYYRGVYNV